MLIDLIAFGVFIPFLPFVYLAGRKTNEERKLQTRFATLRTSNAGASSPNDAVNPLRASSQRATNSPGRITARILARLQISRLLLQANSQMTVWTLLRFCGLAILGPASLILFATHNATFTSLVALGSGIAPWLLLRFRAQRRTAAMNKALPQVLDMISRALRAGHSLPAALGIVSEEAVGPARSAFNEVFQKQRFGLPIRDALMDLIQSFPSDDLKVLVTAILVQRDTGGNLVQILDRTSAMIRARLKLQGDVRVHTAQGRMTGWILCLLPVLMLGFLLVTNPAYPRVLLDDPFGRKLIYGSLVLLAIGAFLIRQIIKKIEVMA